MLWEQNNKSRNKNCICFFQMKGEKPPAPTLGVTPKGGDDEEEGEDEEDSGGGGGDGTPVINMADLVDRVDIR